MKNLGDLFGVNSVIQPGDYVKVNSKGYIWMGCMESDAELVFRYSENFKKYVYKGFHKDLIHIWEDKIYIVEHNGSTFTKNNVPVVKIKWHDKIKDNNKTVKINCGIWEEKECTYIRNSLCSGSYNKFCKHAKLEKIIKKFHPDGQEFTEPYYLFPRVLVAINEGGHNSTGVCLDCLDEELEKIK
jgi:hypothetical protein